MSASFDHLRKHLGQYQVLGKVLGPNHNPIRRPLTAHCREQENKNKNKEKRGLDDLVRDSPPTVADEIKSQCDHAPTKAECLRCFF
jgi:hypothetical protein